MEYAKQIIKDTMNQILDEYTRVFLLQESNTKLIRQAILVPNSEETIAILKEKNNTYALEIAILQSKLDVLREVLVKL